MSIEKVQQFIDELKDNKNVQKNLYPYSWVSGSSTRVMPITIGSKEIVLQWNSDKQIFDRFINRMVEKYNDILEGGYFWKSDGSCPSTITFILKEPL